jgi:aspartate kinase
VRVYKFGGASIADAAGIKRLGAIAGKEKNLFVIVSAMGKMTNAFEQLVQAKDQAGRTQALEFIKEYHLNIVSELFEQEDEIFSKLHSFFEQIEQLTSQFAEVNYDFLYDQVVSFGELISSTIVNHYLQSTGVQSQWLDARKLVRTDESYREALVNWQKTEENIQNSCKQGGVFLSQGFIAGSENGLTTTLGREGSDYSAAIMAYALGAESLTIWKDVEGVLNADPRYFQKTELLRELSYGEAIEMAFYGASVIHPKTLKPLENAEIPLRVKSFLNPEASGTTIAKNLALNPFVPCYILKREQVLISISARDFSFIVEQNITSIFQALSEFKLKVNLIQNSALEFVVCVTDKYGTIEGFKQKMQEEFVLKITRDLRMYTIRHFDLQGLSEFENEFDILLKQRNNEVYQLVVSG